MSLSPVPPGCFWAKLDRERTRYHPLAAHSADVAAVLWRLLQPDSQIAARLARTAGLPRLSPSLVAALVYLAALHDFGKANHGFQEQALPKEQRRRWPIRGHVKAFFESLSHRPFQRTVQEILAPLRPEPARTFPLLAATVCHHGRPWNSQPALNPAAAWERDARSGRAPLAEVSRLAALARAWSGVEEHEPEPLPLGPAFTHLYAGALTLADWIGSTESAFPFAPEADTDTVGYYRGEARGRAGRACAKIGVVPATTVVSLAGTPLLEQVFPGTFPKYPPTPLQKHIAEMPLPPAGSRILIESDTGSGKTEAAVTLYARLRAEGRVGGLLFALPTRATASAMLGRVELALAGMYEGVERPTVALAMGGTQVRVEAGEPFISEEPLTHPDPGEEELVRWSSSSAKKFFSAEIVVGTVDQVLLGGLAVRHAHLRLAALSRHLLVVDEVHSYDRYMAQVLAEVLEFHTAAGGTALLMSATLAEEMRARFGGAREEVLPLPEAVARAYPVVSVCKGPGEGWRDEPVELRTGASRGVAWKTCTEDEGIREAVAAARAGARVCILRNTVRGARAVVQQMRGTEVEALLWQPDGSAYFPAYHSRYTPADRAALDRAVLKSFGRGSDRAGVILVSTQVVEQSLDLDFDLLVTDLCPVDVLLQRAGRVHRHPERMRIPGFEVARVSVIVPAEGIEPLIQRKNGGPHGWGTVYENLGDLELTTRRINAEGEVEIPRDNRRLIEDVYHPERREALSTESSAWQECLNKQDGRDLGREGHALGAVVDFRKSYSENADRFHEDAERGIRTRLGDDRVRVRLPVSLRGWYSDAEAEHADLPENFVGRSGVSLTNCEASGGEREADRVRFRLGGLEFFYGTNGWEWD